MCSPYEGNIVVGAHLEHLMTSAAVMKTPIECQGTFDVCFSGLIGFVVLGSNHHSRVLCVRQESGQQLLFWPFRSPQFEFNALVSSEKQWVSLLVQVSL